jgi:hypothetical protein
MISGPVFGWCYSRYDGPGIMLKYVLPVGSKQFTPQRRRLKRIGLWAGLMSRNRGIHRTRNWDGNQR